MEEIREEMRLNRREWRLNQEQYRELSQRHETLADDMRQFMHEAILRMERMTDRHAAALDRQASLLDDIHDEMVAQRGAMLQVLDRLMGGGPGAAPAGA
jgi:hypothetical protein